MMNVDALWMENGIVLVWEWGVKDSEEVPVNYTQLPDAIPNWKPEINGYALERTPVFVEDLDTLGRGSHGGRSEEHTSELQSQFHLVCRLLLEKKKKKR